MVIHEQTNNVARFLTSEETVELARIQKDNSVIGYVLLALDGTEIEASGAWRDMLAPVFANIFDITDTIGREFGELESCPMIVLESEDFEVAGVMMSSARAVFIRRKTRKNRDGLRSIS